MTFKKLFKIITEAKDEKPGMRYHSAKQNVGPSGIVSGPVGKSDNFELRKPIKKWDFDLDNVGSEVLHTGKDNKSVRYTDRGKGAGGILRDKRNILSNAFGILKGDPNFEQSVLEISKEFDQNRENYRHYIFGEEPGKVKYDEESKLESLSNSLQKSAGRIASLIDIVVALQDKLKLAKYKPVDIINIKRDVDVLRAQLETEESKTKDKKDLYKAFEKASDELEKKNNEIDRLKGKLEKTKSPQTRSAIGIDIKRLRLDKKSIENELAKQKYTPIRNLFNRISSLRTEKKTKEDLMKEISRLSPESIAHDTAQLENQRAKLEEEKAKWDKLAEEADNLNERVNQIGKINFENNQIAVRQFLHQIVDSATKVDEKLSKELSTYNTVQSLQDLDWEKLPETLKEKKAMAETLKTLDSNNPIIGYLDAIYRRMYAIPESEGDIFDPSTNTFKISTAQNDAPMISLKELRPEEFNKNVNITSVRDFNSLPFVRLMNVYSNQSIPKISLVGSDSDIDYTQFRNAWNDLYGRLTSDMLKYTLNPELEEKQKQYWESEKAKNGLRKHILSLGLGEFSTKTALQAVARPWSVTKSSPKRNSYGQLLSTLESLTAKIRKLAFEDEPITESFDEFYNSVIKTTKYNPDIMKIGLLEIIKPK